MISQLNEVPLWDIVIIGGGATGLGTAVDAASRGYKTLLVEQFDFAKGTSSRSTKLVHGGVRYLAQGNIRLVMDALKERGILLKNAPHITSNFSFVIPAYKWWEKMYYGFGLKIYDIMAGRLSLGSTKIISKKTAQELLPTAETKNLRGGIVYRDGQFDDTRLAINLAQTAEENGATILNYCKVIKLEKQEGIIAGVHILDSITGKEMLIKSTNVINATGVFTDAVLKMDDASQPKLVAASQGVHIVLDKKYFPGNNALMVPRTADGRVLFAVPWHGKVVVGTTDTPVDHTSYEPTALEEEINFILTHINLYLSADISRKDVRSVFVGLRPLVKNTAAKKTSLLPRDHTVVISKSKLVSITGGKWTTYRKMAKDVLDKTIALGQLEKKTCVTEGLKIHGWTDTIERPDDLYYYGSDAAMVKELYKENPAWKESIHPALPYTKAMVIWAVRNEMAMTVEDVMARRTRSILLDAGASIEASPIVAELMANEMRMDESWIREQLNSFISIAKKYTMDDV
ncbi:glycerol-3-phosphate dehydrogenase/oxidase [Ferruginibacter sp. HRS2-29]|nr:glycerol-3-phosphate dehydrogenase/oxidase [Ferruginibacter sp. HRS2-29]